MRRKVTPPVSPAQFQRGHAGHKKKRFYTRLETQTQLRAVEQLLIKGASLSQVTRIMRTFEVPCGLNRTKSLINRVHAQWETEGAAERSLNRTIQIKRLIEVIEKAKNINPNTGEWVDPNYAAIVSAEKLLADLQGTREAPSQKVEVRVQHSLLSVMASLQPEEIDHMLQEQNEIEAAARAYQEQQDQTH